ncbi:MAG: DUF4115 domain-containing protein [Woeseiaceae bacterium]|nr:DUF4115 domain-containing protein [Woeseiaceae bacterium]
MSDTPDKDAASSAVGPVAGERLAEARRLRQISLPDIARELHLDEARVQALEENRFDVLGAPVFAKGHLRKYAEVVGVPVDDVMADYYTLSRSMRAMPVVGRPQSKPPHEIRLGPWLAAIVVVLVVAAAAWWWLGRVPSGSVPALSPSITPATRVPVQRRTSAADDPADVAPADAAPDPSPEAAAGEGDAAPGPAAAATGRNESVPPAPAASVDIAEAADTTAALSPGSTPGTLTLTLAFSGDCWTEVTDRNGERLFFDLGSDGRTVTLNGTPPLNVLLGDSTNVSLAVNGEPYAIAAADRRGDTARFTIRRR